MALGTCVSGQTILPRDYRGQRPAAALCAVFFFFSLSCAQSSPTPQTDQTLDVPAPFPMRLSLPVIPSRQFDIREFGAVDGGNVKCTGAIQRAIDSIAGLGGGTVLVPAGRWLTGAIHLKSNTDLHLSKGAELLFSQQPQDYLPVVFSRHEDIECMKYSSFIHAEGKKNISITGEGILNGQGKPWWSYKQDKKDDEALLYEMGSKGVPVEQRVFDGTHGRELRPAFFQPMNCSNVLVEGVTFLYGAFWTITPTYCDNVVIRNVHIQTEGEYGHTPNGDGVDPSSCRKVLIENCDFNTGDDCVAIKAGRDADGLRVGMPTENVVVRNCRGLSGHGGIVIGSETSGGIRNVYAVDCRFEGTDRIVRIKTARGRGGIIEDMWFANLTGKEIRYEAIHLNMLYTGSRLPAPPVSEATPTIRNIHFHNITCSSGQGYGVEMLGLPERAISNISLDSIDVRTLKGVNLSDVQGIRITNSRISSTHTPLLNIVDGRDIAVVSVSFAGNKESMVRVEGATSRNISIRKSNIQNAGGALSLGPEVPRQAVLIEE